jgi:hypothetical protein
MTDLGMSQHLRNILVIIGLSGLMTACGNSPFISGMLGLPTNGAISTNSNDTIEIDDEFEAANVSEIPSDVASEVEISTGTWSDTLSSGTAGSNSATPLSDGSVSGEDPAISDSVPGADTPDSYLPSGTVDLPVSIAKEDEEIDVCSEGDIQPVMLSYSGSSQLSRTSNNDLSNDRQATMTYTRVARTGRLTLGLSKNNLTDQDSIGEVGYEQCQIEQDKEGKSLSRWQPLDTETIRHLGLYELNDLVVGTMTQSPSGWTQNAVRIPLDEKGYFRFSGQLLKTLENVTPYVGVLWKVDETDAEPLDALVFKQQGSSLRMDRTRHLKTYIQNEDFKNAPSINLNQ